jgi:hypothetical protein
VAVRTSLLPSALHSQGTGDPVNVREPLRCKRIAVLPCPPNEAPFCSCCARAPGRGGGACRCARCVGGGPPGHSARLPPLPRRLSARTEFSALVRLLPTGLAMPVSSVLSVALPLGGVGGAEHRPLPELVTIEGIKDEIDIMASLQKPKKVRVCARAFA